MMKKSEETHVWEVVVRCPAFLRKEAQAVGPLAFPRLVATLPCPGYKQLLLSWFAYFVRLLALPPLAYTLLQSPALSMGVLLVLVFHGRGLRDVYCLVSLTSLHGSALFCNQGKDTHIRGFRQNHRRFFHPRPSRFPSNLLLLDSSGLRRHTALLP
jgi:hypothetical protein